MPMTYITLARTKKLALGWIEKAGAIGIEAHRIPRHVARSLMRDEQIIRRDNVYIAAQYQ